MRNEALNFRFFNIFFVLALVLAGIAIAPAKIGAANSNYEFCGTSDVLKKYDGYSSRGRGHLNSQVRSLQQAIKDQFSNINIGTPDGYFGSGTESAVRTLQRQTQIDVDGKVGRQTRGVLCNGSNGGGSGGGSNGGGSSGNSGDKLSHSQARNILRNGGITTIKSSGNCSNRDNRRCTSLKQVRRASVDGLVAFKKRCGAVMGACTIHVTGGTEVGHSSGTYSHYNGYKIDISRTFGSGDNFATRYIKNNFTLERRTSLGPRYRDPVTGYLYLLESDHWDICFNANCR